MHAFRLSSIGAVAAAGALIAAGCGSSSNTTSSSSSGSTSQAQQPAKTTTGAAMTPKATVGSGSVAIGEDEFHLLPSTIHAKAGKVVIKITNKGRVTHALTIEKGGPGGKDAESGNIDPGGSGTMTATLKKGTYEIYCPVDGHKSLGMKGELVVS
jgi:uncharacterized cupredoxin-like copper-binding protein